MIYADNAATTKLDIDAFDAMKEFLTDSFGNPSQPYSFARRTKKALRESREIIASCINALPEEVYFTSGGTESDNWALKGFMKRQENKRVIVSSIEHHAVLHTVQSLEREGYDVCFLDVTTEGVVLPSMLESKINNDTAVVSVMFANNEVGSIQPVAELAEIAHGYGAAFHSDAVQAVGHIDVDVKKLGIDMLSASAHKFNGPRGIGFLYIKNGIKLYPFMDGGAQERSMRAGTENVPAIVGMAVALKKSCEAISEEKIKLKNLEEELLSGLKQNNLDFIRNGAENHLPGNVSLSFRNSDGEMLLHRLDLMGIYVSTGSACDSKNTQVSHVLRAMGVPEEYAKGTIRISFGKDNTLEDVREIVDSLTKILS
ncbi:cysteine desulfurase [Eubacterium ruminantium]|nr:cysteine desulfurase [Eubacterium ruminantium]